MPRLFWVPVAIVALSLITSAFASAQEKANPSPPKDRSHSAHGPAFNEGPRQVAWRMSGIGTAHFPVTTSKPEAQAFFDQGINLLHSFWYFEAERAFRHAAWLDPECAMAYWGMAMADQEGEGRKQRFLKLARAKMAKATERERRFIEALWERVQEGDGRARQKAYVEKLEEIVLDFPDDVEAKAFLALTGIRGGGDVGSRVAREALIREILAKSPDHPGAHHYRIHLWDGPKGDQALESCRAYARVAPGIGHALHMPGHIYAQLGRWEEAARAMEAAARVERRYFREHGMLPYHSWNYSHDLHYLVAIQGYLGRAAEGMRLARELIAVPHDPSHNSKDGGAQREGRVALMRMLVRFERWDAILGEGGPEWNDTPQERGWQAYCQGLAHLGKGNREAARQQLEALEAVHAELVKAKNEWEGFRMETAGHELGGLLLIAEGKTLEGFERLGKAADLERTHLKGNDPAPYPRPILETVGRAHIEAKNWGLAEAVFQEALKRTPNSGPALAGLSEACLGAGKRDAALAAYEKLAAVWKYADADLPIVRRVQALGLGPRLAAADERPTTNDQRPTTNDQQGGPDVGRSSLVIGQLGGARWESGEMAALGPDAWEPAPAPPFALKDAAGKSYRLADYKGKNLVLVFYLGGDCSHCVQQLQGLGKEAGALKERNSAVLAISAAPALAKATETALLPFPVVYDSDHAVAKRYQAHDTFESRDLHAVVFIDPEGRVRWYTVGAAPFTDWAFLKGEIDRVGRLRAVRSK